MAKVIAIFNHKGGVGKTTTAASIGAGLAEEHRNVLMIDLDPQSNLTASFLQEIPDETIYNTFTSGKALNIVSIKSNLDLVPSDISHSTTEITISSRMQREFILRKAIKPILSKYDYILLDCPPSLGLISINALTAADMLIVPMSAEILPSKGLRMLTDMVEQIQDGLNPSLYICGILITRYESARLSESIESALRNQFGDTVFSTNIRKNVRIAEAPANYQSILDYDSKSNGASDYRQVVKELIARVEEH